MSLEFLNEFAQYTQDKAIADSTVAKPSLGYECRCIKYKFKEGAPAFVPKVCDTYTELKQFLKDIAAPTADSKYARIDKQMKESLLNTLCKDGLIECDEEQWIADGYDVSYDTTEFVDTVTKYLNMKKNGTRRYIRNMFDKAAYHIISKIYGTDVYANIVRDIHEFGYKYDFEIDTKTGSTTGGMSYSAGIYIVCSPRLVSTSDGKNHKHIYYDDTVRDIFASGASVKVCDMADDALDILRRMYGCWYVCRNTIVQYMDTHPIQHTEPLHISNVSELKTSCREHNIPLESFMGMLEFDSRNDSLCEEVAKLCPRWDINPMAVFTDDTSTSSSDNKNTPISTYKGDILNTLAAVKNRESFEAIADVSAQLLELSNTSSNELIKAWAHAAADAIDSRDAGGTYFTISNLLMAAKLPVPDFFTRPTL